MNKNISKKVRRILSFPLYLFYTRTVSPIYKRRMAAYIASLCDRRGKVLDVGCDDGSIAELIMEQNPALKVTGIDVQSIRKARIQRVIYDGKRIPYPDNSFETVIAVDVLHHTQDIEGLLKEMGRVSKKYVVIKDHRRYGWPSFMLLSFFDWLGNFPFGIRCVFNYPSLEEWNVYFKEAGLRCVSMQKKLKFFFFVGSRYNPIFQLEKIKKAASEEFRGGLMMDKKLNIAFVSDTFCPDVNGIATYLKIISKALSNKGHQVTIYTHKKAVNPFGSGENVKVVRLPSVGLPTYKGIYACIPNPLKLRRSIILQNPDVIHIHSPPGPLSITALIIAKSRKIPVVATVHGFWDRYENYISFFMVLGKIRIPFGKKILKLVKRGVLIRFSKSGISGLLRKISIKKPLVWHALRTTYNQCDLVTAPSRLSAKKLADNRIRCVTLPYGVDAKNFRVKKSYARTGRILSVCRLGYEKNLDVLIRAFSLLLKKHPKARLTLVGDGPARSSLVELAGNLELQGSVSFEGAVERSRLQEYFDTHDFFANASDSETFGYVTAEAMAAGLPVVAIDAQGSKDLVRNRVNGFLVKPNRIVEFAKAMERMMDKKTDLRGMGAASRRLVLNFSVENCYDKHVRVYGKLVNQEFSRAVKNALNRFEKVTPKREAKYTTVIAE